MPTPEGLIKTAICYYLLTRRDLIRLFWVNSSVGIYDPTKKIYRSNNSKFQIKGTSDILGVLKGSGKLLAIEVKSKKGVLSLEQKIFIEEVNAAGGVAFVARSVQDVIDYFAKITIAPIPNAT